MLERPEQAVDRRPRRWLVGVLAGYGALLALILLWPVGEPATAVVAWCTRALGWAGAPVSVASGGRVEFALNALMVVPVPLLVSLLWPRWTWQQWTAYGFLGSLCVEGVQAVFLAGRSAQFVDVVANTLGALVGALLAVVLRRRLSR